MPMQSMLADPGLAAEGRRKIDFAARWMPVLRRVEQDLAATRPLAGLRIAACLHVTPETANLCRALVAGGAELALCASNPLSTKDEVAAAIAADLGVAVFAVHGCDRDTFYRQVEGALAIDPNFVVDDGADLTARLHADHPDRAGRVVGGTEVTTTGVVRLRNMAAAGALRHPMVAVNDARTKHLFDNRYGTGQNTVDGILRATNILLAGSAFLVVGYGWCGRGIAMRARGMGARVLVAEVDAVKVLEAVMDGFQVLPVADAIAQADVVVTATGNRDVIRVEHLLAAKPGAIMCNSGHFDVELDMARLRGVATAATTVRPEVVEYRLPGGGHVVVLAEGRLVGQSCAEAHPAAIMDLGFSTNALAVERLATDPAAFPPGVHQVPGDIDARVARFKVAALGVAHDQLTDDQAAYLASWTAGT